VKHSYIHDPFLDITCDERDVGVSVEVSADDKVLWVTVNGTTVLRICRIPHLEMQ